MVQRVALEQAEELDQVQVEVLGEVDLHQCYKLVVVEVLHRTMELEVVVH